MASREAEDPPPRKKRKLAGRSKEKRFETLAAQPSLDLLPDSVLLHLMALLDVHSILRLARVCRRFQHLHNDEYAWQNVDLSTLARRLDIRKVKQLVRHRFPSTLTRIRITCAAHSRQVVNEKTMDELFVKCPYIEALSLELCDLTEYSSDCKLFRSPHLRHLSLLCCTLSFKWMSALQPHWPALRSLSLKNSVKSSDNDLSYIAHNEHMSKNIRFLNIDGCYRITDRGLSEVCNSLSNLQLLDILNCKSVSVNVLQSVAKLTHLQHLALGCTFWAVRDTLPALFPTLKCLVIQRDRNHISSGDENAGTTPTWTNVKIVDSRLPGRTE